MRSKLKALGLGLALAWIAACGFDPRRPFDRMSPEVDKAIGELDSGKAETATGRLTDYLQVGRCDGGHLAVPGPPDAENAAFDLGLTLFKLAEQFGRRFEEGPAHSEKKDNEEEKRLSVLRGDQIDCARVALDAILARPDLTPELEARARYLRGNLAFLDRQWDDAVKDYDQALKIIPGLSGDAGDGIGRDTAWNRALALRHKEEDEKRDGGADADADADGDADADADGADGDADADADGDADADADAPPDAPPDAPDGSKDGPEDGPKEAQADSGDSGPEGGQGDAAGDAPSDGSKEQPAGPDGGQPDAGPASPAPGSQDDRMLDQFEQAPTWQKEEAKARGGSRKIRGMQDK